MILLSPLFFWFLAESNDRLLLHHSGLWLSDNEGVMLVLDALVASLRAAPVDAVRPRALEGKKIEMKSSY